MKMRRKEQKSGKMARSNGTDACPGHWQAPPAGEASPGDCQGGRGEERRVPLGHHESAPWGLLERTEGGGGGLNGPVPLPGDGPRLRRSSL